MLLIWDLFEGGFVMKYKVAVSGFRWLLSFQTSFEVRFQLGAK